MKLQKATINDWEILLKWRNNVETRKSSHTMKLVKTEDHKKWLNSIIEDKHRKLYIAIDNEVAVGTVRADYNEDEKNFLLSWTVAPSFRGKGLGKVMVKLLTESLNEPLTAEIKAENIGSIKIAEFAGLKLKQELNGVMYFANF